jgi:S1-C subfamily serine protease
MAGMAAFLAVAGFGGAPVHAAPKDVLGAVYGVRAEVPGDARTAETLGRERTGSGVLIDRSGLVVTIGYLVLEASSVDLIDKAGKRIPAEVVGYDHDTGFGMVRATLPIAATPAELGDSTTLDVGEPALVVANVGGLEGVQAKLVDRREFAGYWEYLLDDALFTTPRFDDFGGAALLDTQGRLLGIGSLQVGDASGSGIPSPGNMFVPIDALKPLLANLEKPGSRDGPARPWLGVYLQDVGGHLIVGGVADEGPAAKAGVAAGDLIVGVGEQPVEGLGDFYRRVWATGDAGVSVPLDVLKPGQGRTRLSVQSIDRLKWLKLDSSF